MPSLTREIPHGSDVSRRILRELQFKVRNWERQSSSKFTKWREAEEKVLAFIPEREIDTARRAAREGGLPQYTTIQIPYSYAVVMSAHTYLTSVFFGRDPVFQYSGRHGESQQQVQAIEALVAYQVLVGRMLPYLYTWLYDPLKYGVGIIGLWWDERFEAVSQISEQPELDSFGQPTGKTSKLQSTQMTRAYAGNCVYNVQPQSFIWDTRYTMREFQRGDYCGEKRRLNWNEIVRRQKMGYYTNIEFVGPQSENSQFADTGSSELERPESLSDLRTQYTDEMGKAHPAMVGIYQLVVELIPKEWSLGSSDWPEKWVLTCTDDFRVLIGCQPLGALHCRYPYSVTPYESEGYGLTTRGMPEILEPIQNTLDWLINSHFYNVRASLNNQFVVDPSRVVMKDVTDPLPGGIIRLKPEAYGTDPRLVMNQLPVMDVTQSHIPDMQLMFGIGERAGGVNDQIMGMLAGGGRKTATEVRTSTSMGINRLKTVAEFTSAVGFDPLAQMIVQNTQQYFDMEMKIRIAGDLTAGAGPGFLQVTPDSIAGFYDFVPVDGTLPIDRMAQVGIWQQLFQAILAVPQIGMQYDLGGIFQWVAQLAGLKNITQFRIQVAPDQLLAAQAQQGNVVPMKRPQGAGPSGAQATGGANPGAAGPGKNPAYTGA